MESKEFGHSTIMNFNDKVEYSSEGIVSKRILQKEKGNVSLFAFDKGQQLSEHSAPFDALVQVLDGEGEIVINGKSHILLEGESIIMPANVPHAVIAAEKFKMLLTMIKSE
ncbi:MAG: cupin domain-containing protein [Bacteroidales bacterium]|nr:cupin domain-containing protein [Bacteroidales bacterium]